MTSAPDEIDGRSIHYKHCDANFYQTFAFVFGRLISTIPQVCENVSLVGWGRKFADNRFLFVCLHAAYH